MSIVIVKHNKNSIELGSDTQHTHDHTIESISHSKIRMIDDNCYVAGVGNAHLMSLFYAYIEKYTIKDIYRSSDIVTYFYNFHNSIKELMLGVEDEESISELIRSSEYLIIVNNKVWQFNWYYVREIKEGESLSIGSGKVIAETALKLKKNLKSALKITCQSDIYCSEPIEVYNLLKN